METNIYLHDEERGELEMAGVHGCTVHGKGSRLKVGKEGMVGYVAATGQMRYAPDVRKDPYYIACEESTLSEVAIPLLVDGQLVGVFCGFASRTGCLSPASICAVAGLVRSRGSGGSQRAPLSAGTARAPADEPGGTRGARHPAGAAAQEFAVHSRLRISGLSIPAGAVGGDWYDFISFDDGCWGLVLADVSGKGTAAALLMSATRGMLRSLAQTCSGPGEVLTRLNRLLVEDFPSGRFVTMLLAVLNPSTRS